MQNKDFATFTAVSKMPEISTKDISQFVYLIKWASNRYSNGMYSQEFDFSYFYEEGMKVFSLCLDRFSNGKVALFTRIPKNEEFRDNRLGKGSSHPIISSFPFSKYFKTSLFRKFDQIKRRARAKKRSGVIIQLDSESGGSWIYEHKKMTTRGGFVDVDYDELVSHVASGMNKIEKAIFTLKANPSDELCNLALLHTRRKERSTMLSGKMSWGAGAVRINDKQIRSLLKKQGFDLTTSVYKAHLNSMRTKVAALLHYKGTQVIRVAKYEGMIKREPKFYGMIFVKEEI